MCREQLGKLPARINELTAEGAAVLGVSRDLPQQAAGMARELGLPFPILSDPYLEVIRAYGMKGEGMEMAELGYVVIDKQGRIRMRRTDRRFGENLDAIIRALREAKAAS